MQLQWGAAEQQFLALGVLFVSDDDLAAETKLTARSGAPHEGARADLGGQPSTGEGQPVDPVGMVGELLADERVGAGRHRSTVGLW